MACTSSRSETELRHQPDHLDAEPGVEIGDQPFDAVGEKPRDMAGIARRPRRVDGQLHDLVVDAEQQEMEGLRPGALGLQLPGEPMARSVTVMSTSSISPIGSAKFRST